MGFLDFKHEKYHYQRIKKALARRGLKIDKSGDWEVHGPHEGMNYQMYIGYAYKDGNSKAKCICQSKSLQNVHCNRHKRYYCVAIYPKSVYEVEDIDKWWDTHPENRILIK